jgi:hypothetical protein
MGKAFWLGIIGGIFGILGGILAYLIASFGASFGTSSLFTNAAGALIFSVVGIVGGMLETRKMLGAALMIIGAFGVVISISIFGVLTFILFLVGGIVILMQKKEQAEAPPVTGQNAE